jgi:hypothetical protein
MPTANPRILVTVDPPTEDALEFLVQRYGLSKAALVRLALRRLAEAEGWNVKKAAA